MKPEITEYISYEVKKEIADRYFGFRKLIEEDKLDLCEKIKQHSYILEKRICFDLLRIYVLLREEHLIGLFLELTGIEAQLFYNSLLPKSPGIQERVFENIRFHGLTRAGRFLNFGLDSYDRLALHIKQYGEQLDELFGDRDTINEEIKLFYRKNDITAIMSFLQAMGNPSLSSGLEGGMEVGLADAFEKKMRIEPPFPIEQHLPVIPPLKPLKTVRPTMTALMKKAYKSHDQQTLSVFSFRFPFLSRDKTERNAD
jgi:hypothetical protein